MKRSGILACVVGLMLMANAPAWATGGTIAGDTMSVTAGFPWVMPNTNYRWTITTNGSNGRVNQPNMGDNFGGTKVDLGIADGQWLNATAYDKVTMSGTITQLPTGSSSYLQIGLVTRKQAERAADWYMSGMFNNSAFINFNRTSVSVGDTNTAHTTIVSGLQNTDQVGYEVEFLFPSMTVRGRTSVNGGPWSAWAERSFGLDNWGWGDENLSYYAESAFLVDFYPDAGTSTASFGDIAVSPVVPEPLTMGSVGLALAALGRYVRRRVKA